MASTIRVAGIMWPTVYAELGDWVAVTYNGIRVLGQIGDYYGDSGVLVDFPDMGAGYFYDWGDIEPVTDEELGDLE
jgi:hypothetical protein